MSPVQPEQLKILIVEDVDSMRELLKHALMGVAGFTVCGTAANGWEARIEISRHRPDLILLDEVLPGESALDLLNHFSQEAIPVILLTGVSDPSHPLLPLARGRIQKPSWNSLEQARIRLQQQILRLMGQAG